MKRSGQRSKTIAFLAILACLGFSVNCLSADIFPLDVWEEMEIWKQNQATANEHDDEAYNQPKTKGMDKVTKINTTFPFDAQEELNKLGGFDWTSLKSWKVHNINYGAAIEYTTNPYWLPEELRTP